MLSLLTSLDQKLFLFLNGKHNAFFDFIMYWASNRFVWVPFYAVLLYLIIRHFKHKAILIVVMIALMITVSDQISSGLVKNWVHRLRPCHNPDLISQIHLVNGECGGSFGFFSSHASNSFALSVFLILIAGRRVRRLGLILMSYCILVSYSRIYLGCHYPLDVIAGIIFGSVLSYIFARIYFMYEARFDLKKIKPNSP